MLFSGELSITTSPLELPLELPLAAAEELDEAPAEVLDDPVDELDEQAASPAARRLVAVSASTLLLMVLFLVNFDLSSRVYAFERRALIWMRWRHPAASRPPRGRAQAAGGRDSPVGTCRRLAGSEC